MTEEPKCKDCKWLTGKKNIRGIECMHPKNQEKWNKAKTLWMGELRKDSARYKQGSALACKKFEAKESEDRVMSRYIKGKPDFADCEKCSRTYGTLGCCSTVSNEWVYSCLEGMLEKAYANGIKSVEPKRGEWKIEETESVWGKGYMLTCSECGDTFRVTENALSHEHFCRNCGADMRKESER